MLWWSNILLLYPLKTSENQKIPNVSGGIIERGMGPSKHILKHWNVVQKNLPFCNIDIVQ